MITETKLGDGSIVSIGDFVGFKSDFEQYGKLIHISSNGILTLGDEHMDWGN